MTPHEINVAQRGDTLSARDGDGFTVAVSAGDDTLSAGGDGFTVVVSAGGDTLSAGGDGFTVVTIRGELGIAAVPALREQLLVLLASGANRIVVDLSRVTFCDSSGLAVLVGAGRRASLLGGVLRLAAAPPPVQTVLRLTGLDTHFETFATVPAATAAAPVPTAPV